MKISLLKACVQAYSLNNFVSIKDIKDVQQQYEVCVGDLHEEHDI